METHDSVDAAQALQHVHRGRQAAARRVTTPWWYHPAVGLTLAGLVGAGSLSGAARATLLIGSLIALGVLFAVYRRLTGLWINAYSIPGTRLATGLAMLTTLAVLVLANVLEHVLEVRGALVVAGVLLGVGYVLLWRWIERTLVRLWGATP